MSALTLHYHPLSSCCHKVLIALDELGVEVKLHALDFGDPGVRSAFSALWPTGKIPLLVDEGRAIPETSIMIEYLQLHHATRGRRLIPDHPEQALQVRLWDRLFDQYVMTPMQAHTADLLRSEESRDALSVANAAAGLRMAYAMINAQVADKQWAAGASFSLADCAAAPSLFYAVCYVPLPDQHPHLIDYFERLMSRPSVARAIDQARPYFDYFPGKAGLEPRFLGSVN